MRSVTVSAVCNWHTLPPMKVLRPLNILQAKNRNRWIIRSFLNVVYSSPEAASVGLTEDQANKEGFDLKIGNSHSVQSVRPLFWGSGWFCQNHRR